MLPLLYPDAGTREKLLEDAASAPIPELHREMFRFTERFVQRSWESTPADLERLRAAGLSETEIVNWATLGSTQTWFVMSADGGGIPLEGDAVTGPAIGRTRAVYEATGEGLLAAPPAGTETRDHEPASDVAWVRTDESAPEFAETARWAESRYGFVPNLLRALSLQPAYYRRHRLAFELLERPQSRSLSPRHHALVRALVSRLNRCAYSEPTTRALLERRSGDPNLFSRLCDGYPNEEWDPVDRVVLDFATKAARNAYKITDKDAQSFREAGLTDEAYVDVLNTVSIQTSLDRLANVLGVAPDKRPILAD